MIKIDWKKESEHMIALVFIVGIIVWLVIKR
jgi:hypothetical protein